MTQKTPARQRWTVYCDDFPVAHGDSLEGALEAAEGRLRCGCAATRAVLRDRVYPFTVRRTVTLTT